MCQNKNDCSEKLQIVIITRKRIVSSSVWSNDTTLSLVFLGCSNFKLKVYLFKN